MKDQKKIQLYADRPEVGSDLKFAHKVLAIWLEKVIADVQTPFRLAITGKLGSGKSTVIHNALENFEKQGEKYAVAYVDVWKLDHSSARRSTILRVAKDFGIDLESSRYKKLHRSMYGSVNTVDDVTQSNTLANNVPIYKQLVFWYILLMGIGISITLYFFIANYSDKILSETIPEWLKIAFSTIVATAVAISNVVSQKVLQVKSSVNQAPFVGPEEFENAFQAILEDPKLKNRKAIVVFDNIDRAPKSKTEEILTGISAFFDHSSRQTVRNLIILVPFSNITNKELDESTVQKFFDAIVPMPVLMPEDLLDFTREKLAGVGWGKEADEVAQLVDRSDLKTPRSILHFVNEIAAQISLAESLETVKYRNEENAEVTYLAKGSLTSNRVFYAKLKLCERLDHNFLADALIEYKTAHEVFSLDNFKDVKEGEDRKRLFDFLRATEGYPERLPESIEQFMYFKGSDLELSIPGSSSLMEAMNSRSSESIRGFFEKNKDIDSLEKLFVNNFARNKNNSLRKKNSILSILEAFDSDIPSPSLRKELARAVGKLEDYFHELPIHELNKITPVNHGSIENEGVWKLLDQNYQEIRKEANGASKENEEWRVEYLRYVLQQPNGAERADLSSADFKAQYFEDAHLFPILKKGGLAKFAGPKNITQIFDYIDGKNFILSKNSFRNLGEALNVGIENSSKDDTAHIQGYFDKIAKQFNAIISQPERLKELFSNLFEHLKHIETFKATDTMWATIANALETQNLNLSNFIDAQGGKELVPFLILLNQKTSLNSRSNQLSLVRNYLNNSASLEPLKALADSFESWIWVESVDRMLPTELEILVKKDGITIPFSLNADTKGADYLVSKIPKLVKLNSYEELFEALPVESDSQFAKQDFVNALYSMPENFSFGEAQVVLDHLLIVQTPIDSNRAIKVIGHYLDQANNENEISYLLKWSSDKSLNIVSFLNQYKDDLEREDNTSWSDDNSLKFFIVINGSTNRPNDFYETFFDKAIERGIFSAKTPIVAKRVSVTLEKAWNSSMGVTENLLKGYKNAIEQSNNFQKEELSIRLGSLELIAKHNDLEKELGFGKPSLKDKAFNLLSVKDNKK